MSEAVTVPCRIELARRSTSSQWARMCFTFLSGQPGGSLPTREGSGLDSYVVLRYSTNMCGRCGCVKRGPGTAGVRPAVIEGILEPGLLLLLREGDNYGYELVNALEQRDLVSHPVPPARAYEALRRLESEGAVSSVTEASPAGPDRRCYTLTPTGRDRLDRWAEALRLAGRNLRTVLDIYHQNEG